MRIAIAHFFMPAKYMPFHRYIQIMFFRLNVLTVFAFDDVDDSDTGTWVA